MDVVVNDKLIGMQGEGGMIGVESQGNAAMRINSAGMYRCAKNSKGLNEVSIYRQLYLGTTYMQHEKQKGATFVALFDCYIDLTIMIKSAVIVAGGSGQRMGTDIPKQFMLFGHSPVFWHSHHYF